MSTIYFAPEWDLGQEIQRLNTMMGIKYKLHHIKSCQDKSKNISDLPLNVQLNIQADKLA